MRDLAMKCDCCRVSIEKQRRGMTKIVYDGETYFGWAAVGAVTGRSREGIHKRAMTGVCFKIQTHALKSQAAKEQHENRSWGPQYSNPAPRTTNAVAAAFNRLPRVSLDSERLR